MKNLKIIIVAIMAIALMWGVEAAAQRRVTPVNTPATATQPVNENKSRTDTIDRTHVIEMTDNEGRTVLVDTLRGTEFVDSTAVGTLPIPKMIYPLLYTVSVSADLFTPAMRALGQKYGLAEFGVEVNLHNRYIPVLEVGLGQASATPDDNNYTYRSPVAPFFRLGANYNFFYNSNPDYQLFAGVRYGFSTFRYSVEDVTLDDSYWDETERFNIPSQSATAGYFEILLGIRVRIVDKLSLGWTVRYHSLLHETANDTGKAWYIPGFGSRNSSLGATFSLTYTLPFPSKRVVSATSDASVHVPEPLVPSQVNTLPAEE